MSRTIAFVIAASLAAGCRGPSERDVPVLDSDSGLKEVTILAKGLE